MGAPTGKATPATDLPKGTLEIEVRKPPPTADGQPARALGQIHLTPIGADPA
jgi:hypothetical protein